MIFKSRASEMLFAYSSRRLRVFGPFVLSSRRALSKTPRGLGTCPRGKMATEYATATMSNLLPLQAYRRCRLPRDALLV